MTEVHTPDSALLEDWLGDARVKHYLCGHCEGLHISQLQELEGVVNSRVFSNREGVMLSTELEIRPMALLVLAAESGRLNMDYPRLKIFLDVVDDATPQLVVAANLLTTSGITRQQFADFIADTVAETRRLAEECLRLDYLFTEPAQLPTEGSQALH